MKIKCDTITINIEGHLSLWSAIKLRIAGLSNPYEKAEGGEDKGDETTTEEDIILIPKNMFEQDKEEEEEENTLNNIRKNKETGELEINRVYITPKELIDDKNDTETHWEKYEKAFLRHRLGRCPNCNVLYTLLKFQEEFRKNK